MTVRSRISGIGMYVPERILTNADLERMVDTSDSWIQDRTGVRERHIAADNETASTLGIEASRQALEQAEVDSKDLDLPRLERAWQKVIDRHPMLRAIVLPDGLQKILPEVPPYRFPTQDAQAQMADYFSCR